ncbi:MAG: vWA domain-containing protein, partial [Actinomycetales bacterium]
MAPTAPAVLAAAAAGGDVRSVLVGFVRTLRACGVPVPPDRVPRFLEAATALGADERTNVYWAGRLTLCSAPDHLPRYDAAFLAWFGGELAPRRARTSSIEMVRATASPELAPSGGVAGDESLQAAAATASAMELLRQRDIARMTAEELAVVRHHLARLSVTPLARRTRRYEPWPRGVVDRRRTLRALLRQGGEPSRLEHRRPQQRPRRLVVLVDVSGSMRSYADAMLRFGHAAARARPRTEVFTLGTRLTRVTRELRQRDPERALADAGRAIPDWSGGTRLGEVLRAFLDRWGQRGVARRAVVVVFSDGWERGGTELLGEQSARLRRLAHKVVWVNPHAGKSGYAPVQGGIAAALPHVDRLLAGHSL